MLKLVKTSPPPLLEQRVIRMEADARKLQALSAAEIRAVYANIETTRDVLSRLLDKADGKSV
jgi:hypothetical protein